MTGGGDGGGTAHLAEAMAGRRGGRGRGGLPRLLTLGGAALTLALAAAGFSLWTSDGPPPPAEPLFADDFSDGTPAWSFLPRDPGDSGGPVAGEYRLLARPGGTVALAPLAGAPPKVTLLEVRMRLPRQGGAVAGLHCHSGPGAEGGHGYEFQVRAAGRAAIVKRNGARVSDLALSARSVDPGTEGETALRAVCLAEPRRVLLTLWLDGIRVADAADKVSPLEPGGVGLLARGAEPVPVHFDDFRLSRF